MSAASRKAGLLVTLVAAVIGVLVATAGPAWAATVVARWNMEDSGGTMADASGHGHTGTLHGVTVRQPGQSGLGYGFNGKPSYVSVPSSGDFSPGTGNFRFTLSVRFSVLPSSSVGDYDLLRRGLSTTAGGDYKLEILQGGKAFCLFKGSGGEVSVTSSRNIGDNRWHTLSCARVGNSVVLTVDGVNTSRSGNTGTIANSQTLFIGAKDTAGNDQYRGLMDNVSVTVG
jgi:hypothetical protein